jgi:hypothetical protein
MPQQVRRIMADPEPAIDGMYPLAFSCAYAFVLQ